MTPKINVNPDAMMNNKNPSPIPPIIVANILHLTRQHVIVAAHPGGYVEAILYYFPEYHNPLVPMVNSGATVLAPKQEYPNFAAESPLHCHTTVGA